MPARPSIHFMAAAPLDAWARLLLSPGARVAWRYWPRVALNLALSACVTVMTLPERVLLAPVLWWRGRRSGWRLGPARGGGGAPIVVLGYYRSGTTHLHNLLACDPGSCSARWGQVLSPQGFAASWFVLRLFLWAVLPTKRPQDDMAFGPEWPGEDDFALSNWALASPLAGRVIMPRCADHFGRFHDLEGLTAPERSRWRRVQWAILWKIAVLARGRRLVIKSPPHTARVGAIAEVLEGARFIHLSREPGAVLRSNERLMRALEPHHLQDAPDAEVVRGRIIEEYDRTERRFLEQAGALGPGRLARMRYQDLIADPIGSLRRAYEEIGVEWTEAFERRARAYLASVREYRTETQKIASRAGEREGPLPEALRWMVGAFGHDRPAVEPAATGTVAGVGDGGAGGGVWAGRDAALAVLGAASALALWMVVAWASGHRWGLFAWLVGIVAGLCATGRHPGSVRRGLACAGLSLVCAAAGIVGATWLVDFGRATGVEWSVLGRAAWGRFTHESTLLWTGLGMVSGFRLGSRRFGAIPGR